MNILAKGTLVALAIILTAASAAMAQTPDPKGCTPQERANQTLEQTGQTAGVICPPDIDPAMKAPTPKTGDMSVIPPSRIPGGTPSVQPK
jgi:hypothetical protein